jgi:hypothetical protein
MALKDGHRKIFCQQPDTVRMPQVLYHRGYRFRTAGFTGKAQNTLFRLNSIIPGL